MFLYFEKDKHVSYYFNNFINMLFTVFYKTYIFKKKEKKRRKKKKRPRPFRGRVSEDRSWNGAPNPSRHDGKELG